MISWLSCSALWWILVWYYVLPLSGSGLRMGKEWGMGKLEPSYVHLLVQGRFSPYQSLFLRNLDTHASLKVHECSGLLKLGWNYWDWEIWGPGSSRGSPRMCCLSSWQDLCQDSGKETWDSSLEQGGVLLKVGTTQPAEAYRFPGATVTFLQSPMVMRGIFKEKRPDSLGIMTSLLTPGHFKTPQYRPTCVPHFLFSPHHPSRAMGSPRISWCLHGGSMVALIPLAFYVLSPAYSSSCRIQEPWAPTPSQASFFFAFCCSNPPWRQWMPWASMLEWSMRQGSDDRGAWAIMKKG